MHVGFHTGDPTLCRVSLLLEGDLCYVQLLGHGPFERLWEEDYDLNLMDKKDIKEG
jgi:hypothetical protein